MCFPPPCSDASAFGSVSIDPQIILQLLEYVGAVTSLKKRCIYTALEQFPAHNNVRKTIMAAYQYYCLTHQVHFFTTDDKDDHAKVCSGPFDRYECKGTMNGQMKK